MVAPESLLWHIFSGFVDSYLILEQGRLDEKVVGWKLLVHNDLYFGNVLLVRLGR